MDETHKFKPVSVDSIVLPRACEMAEGAYKHALEDVWVEARAIMGNNTAPSGTAQLQLS